MFRIYLKNAWRNLFKQRVTSLINLAGLAIGMAAAVLILFWVQNELNFDRGHDRADQIYRITNHVSVSKDDTWVWEASPLLLATEIKKQVPGVEETAQIAPVQYSALYFNIRGEFFPEKKLAFINADWFRVFRYQFLEGSAYEFNQAPFSLILTQSTARKYFGKEPALNKTILIDTIHYQVKGVVADNPPHSSFQFDVLLPIAAKLANPQNLKNETSWNNFNYLTFIRLSSGSDVKKIGQNIHRILKGNRTNDNIVISLLPLKDMHFETGLQSSSILHSDRKTVYVFSVLGVLLLLIACINYVNLTTARASLRIREVSIRKIVGANRRQLLIQFILESTMVSILAMILSLFLMKTGMGFFNQVTEKNFSLNLFSSSLWIVLGSTLLVSVLLTSIYPALLLSSFRPLQIFRGMNILRIKDAYFRRMLVVVQFTISIALIVGVIVVFRQLQYIRSQHRTFDRSQVASITLPFGYLNKLDRKERIQKLKLIKQSLVQESSIAEVASMSQNSVVDMQGFSSGSADWDGRPEGFDPAIAYFQVDHDFNKIVNMEWMEGRWFREGEESDRKNAVINQTAALELGLHRPYTGQRFVSQGDTGMVIGVVKDFHFRNLHDKISPMVIKYGEDYNYTFLIKMQPGKISAALSVMEKAWKNLLPGQPFAYSFVDEEFEMIYRDDRKTATLIWIFAAIAVLISCLGLFGLAAFTAEQRTKEVGIRKVLGASISSIIGLLSRDFILLVVLAFLVACPLAWWGMNKWLQDFAYHVQLDWWIFVLAGLVALLVALVTVSFQARKAAVANPVHSLRSE